MKLFQLSVKVKIMKEFLGWDIDRTSNPDNSRNVFYGFNGNQLIDLTKQKFVITVFNIHPIFICRWFYIKKPQPILLKFGILTL